MNGIDKKSDRDAESLALLGISSAALLHRFAGTLVSIRHRIDQIKYNIDDKAIILDNLKLLEIENNNQFDLINGLRSFSKLSSGMGLGPVKVNSIINNTLSKHYKSLGKDKNYPSYRLDLATELPEAKADDILLSEVIQNLVDNSIRSVKGRRNGYIKIKTHSLNEKVAIDISDNGKGIPINIAKILFLKPIYANESGGLGLGLLIAYSIVTSWGGTIELIDNSFAGTTFRIILNAWKPPTRVSEAKRVIIVEDDIATGNLLSTLFNENDHVKVDLAHTIKEAIYLIDSFEYDIAILDLIIDSNYPHTATGLNIAKLLRERNPEILIVLISGFLSTPIVIDALRSGVDDIINKSDIRPDYFNFVINKAALRRETEKESIRQSQLNKFIYEAVSMISHELRAPLLTVQRNSEALLMGALGPLNTEQADAVENIRTAIQREFLLLNAHLDLRRIEGGAERLNYQKYDLISLIREEISAHKSEAKSKGVNLRTHLPKKKAIVRIDINRFRVALNPIMDNAIKFSPNGANIFVEGILKTDYVEVHVSDQGPGMRPEEIDNLMDLQIPETAKFTQRMRSSGLGLSMAKRMIELHNGKLWIESDGKTGTTVCFRIPFIN